MPLEIHKMYARTGNLRKAALKKKERSKTYESEPGQNKAKILLATTRSIY